MIQINDIKENQSIYQIIYSLLPTCADKVAFVVGNDKITYKELIEKIEVCTAFLVSKGVQKDDYITLWTSVSIDWFAMYVAIMHVGAVVVNTQPFLSNVKAGYLVKFTKSKFILYHKVHDQKLYDDNEKFLNDVVEKSGLSRENIYEYTMIDYSKYNKVDIEDETDLKKNSQIYFTSGSTGMPKAVALSQYCMIYNAYDFADAFMKNLPDEKLIEKILVGFPIGHFIFIYNVFIFLFQGKTVCIPEKLAAPEIIDLYKNEKPPFVWSSEFFYNSITKFPQHPAFIKYLKICVISGMITLESKIRNYEKILHNAKFYNAYGSTDAGGIAITAYDDSQDIRFKTVGKMPRNVKLILKDDDKIINDSDKIGEILVKSPSLKNEYLTLSKEEQCIDSDGWFHTGDSGKYDEYGNLIVVDRINDIICKGGDKISPIEIEREFLECEGVEYVKAFACKDDEFGQNIVLCIKYKNNKKVDEEALKEKVRKNIGSFRMPKYYLVYDEIPFGFNGKVDFKKLKEDAFKRIFG